MRLLRSFLLFLAASLFTACDGPRDNATRRLAKTGVAELRTDAARLHTQYFSGPSLGYFPLRPEQWPESAKRIRPLRIGVYRDGLAIALQEEPGVEFGLHIVPGGLPEPPNPTPFTKYDRLQDGIYFYTLQR